MKKKLNLLETFDSTKIHIYNGAWIVHISGTRSYGVAEAYLQRIVGYTLM